MTTSEKDKSLQFIREWCRFSRGEIPAPNQPPVTVGDSHTQTLLAYAEAYHCLQVDLHSMYRGYHEVQLLQGDGSPLDNNWLAQAYSQFFKPDSHKLMEILKRMFEGMGFLHNLFYEPQPLALIPTYNVINERTQPTLEVPIGEIHKFLDSLTANGQSGNTVYSLTRPESPTFKLPIPQLTTVLLLRPEPLQELNAHLRGSLGDEDLEVIDSDLLSVSEEVIWPNTQGYSVPSDRESVMFHQQRQLEYQKYLPQIFNQANEPLVALATERSNESATPHLVGQSQILWGYFGSHFTRDGNRPTYEEVLAGTLIDLLCGDNWCRSGLVTRYGQDLAPS